jgi:hypothetical protein
MLQAQSDRDHPVWGKGIPSGPDAKKRLDFAEGLHYLFGFEELKLDAYSADVHDDQKPPSYMSSYDARRGDGNNNLLVIWDMGTGVSARELSVILEQGRPVEQGVEKFGFLEVMLVGSHDYCYAHVLPLQGVGELKCQARPRPPQHPSRE